MPKKKLRTKSKRKKSPGGSKKAAQGSKKALKPRVKKKRASADEAAGFLWRERRLSEIPLVKRHPAFETARKYNDTLPLPFGGEVKKDAMRDHGLFH